MNDSSERRVPEGVTDAVDSGTWWILVESSVGGDHRWELVRTIPAGPGRDRALGQAAELTRTCNPLGGEAEDPGAYGRRAFRLTETSRLVEVATSSWSDAHKYSTTSTKHVRITVGRLEHQNEAPLARPPAKGALRRLLGGS